VHHSHGDEEAKGVGENDNPAVEAALGSLRLFGLRSANVVVKAVEQGNKDAGDHDVAQAWGAVEEINFYLKLLKKFKCHKSQSPTKHAMFAGVQPPVAQQILREHQQNGRINALGHGGHLWDWMEDTGIYKNICSFKLEE
jgi:hypothetical protein